MRGIHPVAKPAHVPDAAVCDFDMLQDYCTLLFVAGLDTVINGIGFGIRHLAQDHHYRNNCARTQP